MKRITLTLATRNIASQLLGAAESAKVEDAKRLRAVWRALNLKAVKARVDELVEEAKATQSILDYDDLDVDSKCYEIHDDDLRWLETKLNAFEWKGVPAGLLVSVADLSDAIADAFADRQGSAIERVAEEVAAKANSKAQIGVGPS